MADEVCDIPKIGVEFVDPFSVHDRCQLKLCPCGNLPAKLEHLILQLQQVAPDEIRPFSTEHHWIKVGLVSAVTDQGTLCILVALCFMPDFDVAASAQIAGRVCFSEVAWPMHVGKALQGCCALLRIRVI
jgi:hypothetical protein